MLALGSLDSGFRFSLLACAALLSSCTLTQPLTVKQGAVSGIRDIEFNTSGRLTIVQSETKTGVEVQGNGTLPASLILERDGSTLFIDAHEPQQSGDGLTPSLNLKVYVRELRSLQVRHRGQVQIEPMRSASVSVRIIGDGKVNMNQAEIGRLGINIGGMGRVKLRNVGGGKIQGDVHGQGQISAHQLDVDRLSLRIAGHGAADVSGNVRVQSIRIEGHGAINAQDLATAESNLSIEGHGAAVVWAERLLSLDVQHHGSVQYRGAAKVLSAQPLSNVRELISGI